MFEELSTIMSFSSEKRDLFTLIRVEGDKLDSNVSPGLKSHLVMTNAEGSKNMLLDMSNIKFCDSSGLSAILVGNRLCKNSGGVLVICGINEAVLRLISISQLEGILNIQPNIEMADAFIKSLESGTFSHN